MLFIGTTSFNIHVSSDNGITAAFLGGQGHVQGHRAGSGQDSLSEPLSFLFCHCGFSATIFQSSLPLS